MSTEHVAAQGDCIDSIAKKYGFFADTLWQAEENRALRELRKDRNVLMPGDVVVIPDLRIRTNSVATDKRHTFRRKGVPARLRMKFLRPVPPREGGGGAAAGGAADDPSRYEEVRSAAEEEFEPIAGAAFVLEIDGAATEGRSDADGLVDVPIPPEAVRGRIRFFSGTADEIAYDLALGEMAPVDTVAGVRKRLANLGYPCLPSGEEGDADLQEALRRFQIDQGLETRGSIDQDTRDRLREVHGS